MSRLVGEQDMIAIVLCIFVKVAGIDYDAIWRWWPPIVEVGKLR